MKATIYFLSESVIVLTVTKSSGTVIVFINADSISSSFGESNENYSGNNSRLSRGSSSKAEGMVPNSFYARLADVISR